MCSNSVELHPDDPATVESHWRSVVLRLLAFFENFWANREVAAERRSVKSSRVSSLSLLDQSHNPGSARVQTELTRGSGGELFEYAYVAVETKIG